jgi:hypothetical protein
MATSFHRNARCPHIRLKEGGEDVMLTGGLLPFPRTGCVLYARAILSYGSKIRQACLKEWHLKSSSDSVDEDLESRFRMLAPLACE